MNYNSWVENAQALAAAYARHNDGVLGMLRQHLLSKALSVHMPSAPQRVIDVGGGEGHQAIALAHAGHDVVLLDVDPAMLDAARRHLDKEEPEVAARVTLVRGDGEHASEHVEGSFDVVCCHGILMYLRDPAAMVRSVVGLARPGGLISVLAMNADALAMRPALEGRWADALGVLETGSDLAARYLAGRGDTVENIQALLSREKAPPITWYGIRIFSDHLGDTVPGPGFDELCALEWHAGTRDPYRGVARLFHIMARKAGEEA